uniref:Deoxyhypusine hydroxylase n=1 Tax=Anisakis simplex TaxID=6269 RepID=A0A0M3JS13_ANISI
LATRFRALFVLRNLGCNESVKWIGKCFSDKSALLKHELAYCLGQTQNASAVPILIDVLEDEEQETIVRHEAGEALGAIGDPLALPTLRKYLTHSEPALVETCELAIQRIEWLLNKRRNDSEFVDNRSPYNSVDPSPASSERDVKKLGEILVDASKSLWQRYEAMFALRNLNTDKAIEALSKGLECPESALFRHEVAYVLGQTQSPIAVKSLRSHLECLNENHMVRHECAEALGAIATEQCEELLKKYLHDNESCLSLNDVGRLYKVSDDVVKRLSFDKILPIRFAKQIETLNECVWLCRRPFLEVINCLKAVRTTAPNLRIVLWGKFGTGKSTTLYQTLHYAHLHQWIVFTVRSGIYLTRSAKEIQMSTYHPGRIDVPLQAIEMLQLFKQNNAPYWSKLSELKTGKNYEWTKVEKTSMGRPITDIVEMGLSAPFIASDCVGALLRELKWHATENHFRLLFVIDDANSLFGKTTVKRADRSYAAANDLTLVHHIRKTNGACVMVADKKELSDARDAVTIPLNTPLELFGEEGFDAIEPFIPIETELYTEQETNALYDYYKQKHWIATQNGRSEVGRKQLMYLSAFNPFDYERLCAFL